MSGDAERKAEREPLRVSFPGGLAVVANYRGFSIRTDQGERHGGAGSAPPPFDLFLASIATCAGFYALKFLSSRDLSTEGLTLELEPKAAEAGGRLESLKLTVNLPPGLPEKYRRPLERAIDQCAVKRHIVDPPRFETILRDIV